MKSKSKKIVPSPLSASVGRALRRAAKAARKTARMHGTPIYIGKTVKCSIESNTNQLAELFLFVADHAEHIAKVIRPALSEGKIVISDRYSDSRFAYQGATLSNMFDDAMGWVQSIHKDWTIVPDLTLLFKIEPAVAVSRCGVRGDKTKFEKIEFLKTVQGNFLELAKREPHRFAIIDAGQELDVVVRDVELAIRKFLNK